MGREAALPGPGPCGGCRMPGGPSSFQSAPVRARATFGVCVCVFFGAGREGFATEVGEVHGEV